MFKTISSELIIYPITEKTDSTTNSVSYFAQNIRFQLYKDLNKTILRHINPGLQIGITNLGLPPAAFDDSSLFSDF